MHYWFPLTRRDYAWLNVPLLAMAGYMVIVFMAAWNDLLDHPHDAHGAMWVAGSGIAICVFLIALCAWRSIKPEDEA